MSEQRREPAAGARADSADPRASATPRTGAATASSGKPRTARRRNIALGAVGLLVLALALWLGVPWVRTTLNTVSTDDAYVNGHVTFVAARVKGQVSRVLVDDNYRVRKGDLLVQLDKEPFQIAVAIKKAAVDTATADLQAAKAKVRGIEAEARSPALDVAARRRERRQPGRPAARPGCRCRQEQSRARAGSGRLRPGRQTGGDERYPPRSEYDRRQAILLAARADVTAALADVRQIRASLGLPPESDEVDLGQVPPDLDQTFSSVLQAQADADPERGSAGRHPFVRGDAEADARGVRKRRRRQ